jgi:nucleoside-triphosphatase THEP1
LKGIFILTGPFGSGKTSFCQWFSWELKKGGIDVRGVISPPEFHGGEKTGIWSQDIRSGEKRVLAQKNGEGLKIPRLAPWVFDPETILWVNSFLREAVPCRVLIVDELGPLEFEFRQGFMEAFRAIDSRNFRLALVVIRPEMVDPARSLWKDSRVLSVAEAWKWGKKTLEDLGFSSGFSPVAPPDGYRPEDHQEEN